MVNQARSGYFAAESQAVNNALDQGEIAELKALVAEKEATLQDLQRKLHDLTLWQQVWQHRQVFQRIVRACQFAVDAFALCRGIIFSLAKQTLTLPVRMLGLGRRGLAEVDETGSGLRVGLSQPLPEQIGVGKGTCVVVAGWAFHPERRIRALQIRALIASSNPESAPSLTLLKNAENFQQIANHRAAPLALSSKMARILACHLPRPDVLIRHFPHDDSKGLSLHSGFLAEIALPAVQGPSQVQIVAHADLGGGVIETATLGSFKLLPPKLGGPVLLLDSRPESEQLPLVVICMATYNPPPDLFAKQVESIRKQTWKNWVCIVRDDTSAQESWKMIRRVVGADPRFILRRNRANLGFYKNFDALLHDVPIKADYVALSDQDDYWYPNKLAELLRRFEPGVTLVYSDMRLVDKHGTLLSPTYWTSRVNQSSDCAALLLANTITGAASMFRRSLLEYALPLPEPVGDAYHDWWLGLVALATGHIAYIPKPLYDYVQHPRQVVGHCGAPSSPTWRQRLVRSLIGARCWLNPFNFRHNCRNLVERVRGFWHAGQNRHRHLVHVANLAHNLLLRCGGVTSPAVLWGLHEALSWRDSKRGMVRLCRRSRQPGMLQLTCGVDRLFFQARIWALLQRIKGGLVQRLAGAGALRGRAAQLCARAGAIRKQAGRTSALEIKVAPLKLAIRADSPARLNIVVSTIDFKYLFGSYLTVLNLARCLAERGWRVRLVIVDPCDFRPNAWAASFSAYRGLENLVEQVEFIYAHNRDVVVPVNPNDVFMATSWWTAHVAHAATRVLGHERFVYLIQEYEPGFYPLGPEAALAAASYKFPHYAMFSTELLREYFREQRCGVFADVGGERDSISFENAITTVGKVRRSHLAGRQQKRVLFYCRPEAHAARNLFEIGFLALRQAVRQGAYRGWEIHGIGCVDEFGKLELTPGVHLELLPRMNQEQYRKILPNYDVGLSLMWTPHPSLVPLEMAAAGLCTVTSVYATKTSAKLEAISRNLIPVEGTVPAVVEGLVLAERQAANCAARAKGAAVRWASNWEEAFPETMLARLDHFFRLANSEKTMRLAASRFPVVDETITALSRVGGIEMQPSSQNDSPCSPQGSCEHL